MALLRQAQDMPFDCAQDWLRQAQDEREALRRNRGGPSTGLRMSGRPLLLGEAGIEAFLAALERGAKVRAAAKAAGFADTTFYHRRRRDPDLAEAWDEAVERSAERRPRPGSQRRRTRFCGWRRDCFLEMLALTCNTTEAAEAAGVHRSAVYRRIGRDPGFAREAAAALARGYARLEAQAARQHEAAAARPNRPIVPAGRPTQDFDLAIRLMARWERPDGSLGPRFVSRGRLKRWTFDRAIEALAKRMRGLGIGDC
jgi:hypothetical protein